MPPGLDIERYYINPLKKETSMSEALKITAVLCLTGLAAVMLTIGGVVRSKELTTKAKVARINADVEVRKYQACIAMDRKHRWCLGTATTQPGPKEVK